LESQGIDVKMKCGRKLVIKLPITKQWIAPARHVSDRRKKTGGLGQETGGRKHNHLHVMCFGYM
jgi:hypothetical protein